MSELVPFILPLVCLYWIYSGTRQCWRSKPSKEQADTVAKVSEAEFASEVTRKKPSRKKSPKLASGLFWIALGALGLCATGFTVRWCGTATPYHAKNSDAEIAETIDQLVESFTHQTGFVGLSIAVYADGREAMLGYGQRRLGSATPDENTLFEIGSITKTFTGLMLAEQIELGNLTLDSSIGDLLPAGYSLPDEVSGKIKLRHLTTHTSGFSRMPSNFVSLSSILRMQIGGDPYRNYSEEQFREALAAVELNQPPGEESDYSNFAVGLLGYLMANQLQLNYELALYQQVLQPLGMNDTYITYPEEILDRVARGYRAAIRLGPLSFACQSSNWNLPNHLAGAGGIRSTTSDMLRYLKANIGIMETSLDSSITLAHQELFPLDDDRAFAMNWIRQRQSTSDQTIIWHNGGTGGYRSFMGFDKAARCGVVVLANSCNSVDALGMHILSNITSDSLQTEDSPPVN